MKSLTKTEAVKMLTAKVECIKRYSSGINEDCNSPDCGECTLWYEQGNMGEQIEYLQMAIKALEEPQWVPCSERLPGEYMQFYATVKSLVDNRERWVIEGMYTTIWQWGKIPMIDIGEAEVIAWMPKYLPEPWRGDAE